MSNQKEEVDILNQTQKALLQKKSWEIEASNSTTI